MTHDLDDGVRQWIRSAVASETRPSAAHRHRLQTGLLAKVLAGATLTTQVAAASKASGATTLLAKVVGWTSATGTGWFAGGIGTGMLLVGAVELTIWNVAPPVSGGSARTVADARGAPNLGAAPGAVGTTTEERSSKVDGAHAPVDDQLPRNKDRRPARRSSVAPESVSASPGIAVEDPRGRAPSNEHAGHPRDEDTWLTISEPLAPTGPNLRAELALMNQIQTALRDHAPMLALKLVQRHRSLFPSGQFRAERQASEVFAYCQAGDQAGARELAGLFVDANPNSPLVRRVSASCGNSGNKHLGGLRPQHEVSGASTEGDKTSDEINLLPTTQVQSSPAQGVESQER